MESKATPQMSVGAKKKVFLNPYLHSLDIVIIVARKDIKHVNVNQR